MNAACGFKHRKVWARGGLAKEDDPGWFGFFIWGFLVLSVLMVWVAMRIWFEAIPVFPR
jgi:hypothetical protein